jgi:hypothetical protein
LKALLVGLFTFILVIQAAAAATKADSKTPTSPGTRPSKGAPGTLEERLERKQALARKYRGTIRFYDTHRRLLSSREHRADASARLRAAKRRLARAETSIERLRRAMASRDARRRAAMPPRVAICDVFRDDCREAVNVAWCESRLLTTAQNGQYLGLFQMGSYERRLFGHGSTAHEQALAAHRYFVRSGRDWSPWSCRWAAS